MQSAFSRDREIFHNEEAQIPLLLDPASGVIKHPWVMFNYCEWSPYVYDREFCIVFTQSSFRRINWLISTSGLCSFSYLYTWVIISQFFIFCKLYYKHFSWCSNILDLFKSHWFYKHRAKEQDEHVFSMGLRTAVNEEDPGRVGDAPCCCQSWFPEDSIDSAASMKNNE